MKIVARGKIKNNVAAQDPKLSITRLDNGSLRLTFAPRPRPGAPELVCLDNDRTGTERHYRKTRGEGEEYQSKICLVSYDGEDYAVVFAGRKPGKPDPPVGDEDAEVFVTTPPPGDDDR